MSLNTPITIGHVMLTCLCLVLIWAIRNLIRGDTEQPASLPKRKRGLPNNELVAFSDFVLRNLRGESFRGMKRVDIERAICRGIERTRHQYGIVIMLPLPNIDDYFDDLVNDILASLIRENMVPEELSPLPQ